MKPTIEDGKNDLKRFKELLEDAEFTCEDARLAYSQLAELMLEAEVIAGLRQARKDHRSHNDWSALNAKIKDARKCLARLYQVGRIGANG